MTIKKAYVELIAFLEANKNKKVNTILAEAQAMCESKNSSASDTGTTFLKDENDEVVAIFCYYFKKWMPLCDVEFGAKKNTASGYNTMCKEGVSRWTKQQRVAKKANEELLSKVGSGEVAVEDIKEHQEAIEVSRKFIEEPSTSTIYYDTSEEVLKYLAEESFSIGTPVNTSTED